MISIDFESKPVRINESKKKGTFNIILKAIVDLKMNLKITNEDIKNSNEVRQNRVNDLSLVLTSKYFSCYLKIKSTGYIFYNILFPGVMKDFSFVEQKIL